MTGGAGSVGTELVRTLLESNPRDLVLIDNNEGAVYDLEQDLRSRRLSTFIVDARDKESLNLFLRVLISFFILQDSRIFRYVSIIRMKRSKRTS